MSDSLPRYRERRRQYGQKPLTTATPLGTFKTFVNGSLQSSVQKYPTGTPPNFLFEKCWDVNNSLSRGHDSRARGSRAFRVGGPFTSIKVDVPGSVTSGQSVYTVVDGNTRYEYSGIFTNPYLGFDNIIFPPDLYQTGGVASLKDNPLISDTSALEPRAWDIKPKIERASVLNALYEFKDIPQMLHTTAKTMKDFYYFFLKERYASKWYNREWLVNNLMPDRVADDFLNVEFGWIPFCRDISQMCDYLIFSQQYLDDIARGNDTWIKRRGVLFDEEHTTWLGRGYTAGFEPFGGDMEQMYAVREVDGNLCRATFDVHAKVKTHAWAEGSFKYYRPEFDMKLPDYSGIVMSVNRQITASGLRISPLHVWKAIPWSWLIDWFSNVGKLIERVDDEFIDGMVTKYLYLMHHKTTEITSNHRLFFKSGDVPFVCTRNIDVKQRKAADSPYGFVLGGDLSATQWSILAALGLTRNVKSSRITNFDYTQ